MARGKNVVGLDIGSSAIKVVQLKETKRGLQLLNFGMAPLPPEAIVDGALMNSSAIVDTILELYARTRIKNKDVAIGIAGHSVIIKKIMLPVMTPEELEESIQWEAEQYIPFDINDVNIDVEILNPGAPHGGQMDVLLVAAKKEIVNDYTAVVTEAGLNPVIVDVDSFAVQNQFERNYEIPRDESIVLINVGASVTSINILAKGVSSFTRDITLGGAQFTEEIQKQLNVSYEEAEALKLGGELGRESDSLVPQEVERVIAGVADNLAGEVQRSLDFYAATSAETSLARVYMSGGTSKIPALCRILGQRTGLPVEVMNPFQNLEFDERTFHPDYMREIAPMSAVVVGLGLRRTDEP
jgi:type IV pilus assembly protein PilM